MAMHSIGATTVINDLQGPCIRQVLFADNATAGGSLNGLYEWWSRLQTLGPSFGYFVDVSKTWLIAKAESCS